MEMMIQTNRPKPTGINKSFLFISLSVLYNNFNFLIRFITAVEVDDAVLHLADAVLGAINVWKIFGYYCQTEIIVALIHDLHIFHIHFQSLEHGGQLGTVADEILYFVGLFRCVTR